jgi:murein DD-endopeptidase MepM/ murein hydrolase activator NlpD
MPPGRQLSWRRSVLAGLAAFFLCLAPAGAAADKTYIVKRGDTLSSIARKNDLSVADLAERNGLAKNHFVTTGQRLLIPQRVTNPAPPTSTAESAVSASATLPKSVAEAIQRAPVRAGRWKYVIIHHSATDEGTVAGMDAYHRRERGMEYGLAYHFVIGNGHGMRDGEVAVGNRWKQQLRGGHLRSEAQNEVALGICLVGNFDARPPTARQLQSLNALVRTLMSRCKLPASAVRTHQQINVISTRCPGSKFPTRSFLQQLRQPAR